MKLKLIKIGAFVLGVFPLLIGTDAMAFPGPPPAPPRMPAGGGPPRLPAGGAPRMGPCGPPRGSRFNRPSVPGGGFRGGGAVPRLQTPSRAPNISRPGPSRTGGLAPNGKLADGGNSQPQFPSTVQSLPKGSGSVLPSIAQGKQPGAGATQLGPGPQGKGFPDFSGKSSGLLNSGLSAGSGFALGKMVGAGPEGKGLPNISGNGPSELFNKAPEPLANQEFWKNWSAQNQGKLAEFQANRVGDWNNISDFRNNQDVASSFNSSPWSDYKNNVQNFWDNRAVEVNNNIQNSFDNYFSSDWWKDYGSYADKYAGYADKYASYYDKYSDSAEKYWWWGTATYATAAAWLYAYDRSGNSGYGSGSYDSGSGGYGYGSGS